MQGLKNPRFKQIYQKFTKIVKKGKPKAKRY